MIDKFNSIRPYNQDEFISGIYKMIDNKSFISAMEICLPHYSMEEFRQQIPTFTSVYDFQNILFRHFVEHCIKISTSKVNYVGIENIEQNSSYLFIANHRDIAFDSVMLQNYFLHNKFNTTKIAIGDNLISTPLLVEVARLNKMFVVKRSITLREKLTNYQLLSEFIQHSLFKEHESVWIAQRDGRTKNGIDKTKQGLVKMLSMGKEKDPIKALRKLKITPLTVSYEFEPCDHLKARELALSEERPYQKKTGEDFESIKQGLFGFKGEACLVIGKPLIEELDRISPLLNNNDKINEVCKLIDGQIYQNYKLFPTHYMAYDILQNGNEFSDRYTTEQKEKFTAYLHKKAVTEDVSFDKMMNNLLHIYGNPVVTCNRNERNNL